MDVDQEVIKLLPETAITASHNISKTTNDTKINEQNNKLIILDTESSSSSSCDDNDVEVVKQYKLDDIRPVIGEYSKCSDCEIIYIYINCSLK